MFVQMSLQKFGVAFVKKLTMYRNRENKLNNIEKTREEKEKTNTN